MGKKTAKQLAEQEYKKELKRIQQFLNRASKRGYIWDESPIPKQPKKITDKSVQRLRKLTPESLYKKAKYVVPETGEVVKPHSTPIKQKNTKGNKPNIPIATPPYTPSQTDMVLTTVRELIATFVPPHYSRGFAQMKTEHKNILEQILNNAIAQYGENAVARRLQTVGADEITNIVSSILYDSDVENVRHYIVRFATILKGKTLTPEEAIELADLSEYLESWQPPK